ncbi:MAG: hypothetical protein J5764_03775 [Bacteroidales bacterium]|nr:hypothetical protein [Bacteroidales bacterium]
MEREDPLQRIEREERERAERRAGGTKRQLVIIAVLAAAALILGALLLTNGLSHRQLVTELQIEKQDLQSQIEALRCDYDSLYSDYEFINSQLDSSREEIAQLVERVKSVSATNRSKIRQYEKELGTLRTIMRSYIVQIDSLNNLNHKLTAEAASARKEARETRERNTELEAQVEDLSGQVAVGSMVKARGIKAAAYNQADKVTDKSNRVVRLLVNLSLVENSLAQRGDMTVYLRVTDPAGNLLKDGNNIRFKFGEETVDATAARTVDYEGSEVDLGIYVNNIPEYVKGIYTVQVYSAQGLLGTTELMLR